nr:hypothetical protein [Tanacetum cinerariifolium]
MSSLSAPTAPEITTPIDRARDSLVITPFHDDPYGSTLSPDYTLAFLDCTHDTLHSDEESEPIEASETRIASPSDSTSPLSPDHLLTQTSPTPTPSRAFYYRRTALMAVRTQPTLSPGLLARLTEAMARSPLFFRKRYRGTSKLIADTDTKSKDSKNEGTNSESEEVASKDRKPLVPIESTTADEPLGLGYGTARRRDLELAEDTTHSTFEVGQSSRSIRDKQTPTSPEWSFGSLPVSPASLTVPSPIPSPVTTPAATIAVDWILMARTEMYFTKQSSL